MAAPTHVSSARRGGNARATWSAILAVLSVATMPAAVFGTRVGHGLRLIDAGWAIPVGLVLGFMAIRAARLAALLDERSLGRLGGRKARRFGAIVGTVGVCMALTALISLGVYELLQYRANH